MHITQKSILQIPSLGKSNQTRQSENAETQHQGKYSYLRYSSNFHLPPPAFSAPSFPTPSLVYGLPGNNLWLNVKIIPATNALCAPTSSKYISIPHSISIDALPACHTMQPAPPLQMKSIHQSTITQATRVQAS
ncbi:hypothetical protein M422DRAFT_266793 [Sphaerobolus stellatus SS14]|uniref:Uncharacterized protein n=1 Tax=Sphaerobolus stellatus (strain SS14) TaxID=990650 RepID=A0A0C9V232_SPHS4|nr:hypothetical protein M422DRAFT_266793 [Sphaerobolus stellatus SS14]